MTSYLKLTASDLKLTFNSLPKFNTTEEITPYKSIIGQERAVDSIDMGLLMDKKEYNIYICGPSGTGKTSYIINKIEDYAKNLPCPSDWCYVYNFKDSKKPLSIPLPTGTGIKFRDAIKAFISDLFKKVPTFFDDKSYENEKRTIIENYEKQVLVLSNSLHQEAAKSNFAVEQDNNRNFVFIPLNNGIKMDIETYNKLSLEEKTIINKDTNNLKMISYEVLKKINLINKQMLEELKNLDNKISKTILTDQIQNLKNEFGKSLEVIDYLDALQEDIIQNIDAFLTELDDENEKQENDKDENSKASNNDLIEELFKIPKNFFRRYDINVIVTNKEDAGVPVIYEDSCDYTSLFGKIEYDSIQGNASTDFTMIKPGSLHKANGGFLVMNAEQLLNNPACWETLKRCLKCEKIILQNSKNNLELFPIATLSPKAIPLKLKIILVGGSSTYSMLSYYDYDFNKFFRIKAEFDYQIENQTINIKNILGFISNYIKEKSLLHLTRDGIVELLTYSSRLAENKNYFTAYINKLLEVIDISSIFAKKDNSNVINKRHVSKALYELKEMHGLNRKKVLNMYKDGKYIVSLTGSNIGEINGLSVMDFGDCVVGQQHRITTTTFAGKDGVTNIEREAKMSGNIHSKGIMILSGFIGEFVGQNSFLSFNAKIVFEQLYSGIEGDSASAAELIALLSSLSDVPIKQSMAITGSVNQKGEIQPIGGVNDKIEGYFDICSIYGLDGNHGVIIPNTNTDDLVLDYKVINAVENNLFHIYAVKNIADCIEILFDFNGINTDNVSNMDFIRQRILNKLKIYRELLNEK